MGHEAESAGIEGTGVARGRWGPQVIASKGGRWSDEAETVFLDNLAATCNVTLSAQACGFSTQALYTRRRNDAAFMQRWDAALAHGYAHLEALMVQRAIEVFEGFAPDPDAPVRIPEVSVQDALILLGHHRRRIEGGPRSRREWARPRSLDEVRDSILRKLEAIEVARRAQGGRDAIDGPGAS
jgi:hypothetical protein